MCVEAKLRNIDFPIGNYSYDNIVILRIALINSSSSCRMIVFKLNALLVDAGMETKCLELVQILKK